jgi:hypothetical protein
MIRRVHLCDNGGHFQHLLQEKGIIIKNKIYIAFLHGLPDILNTVFVRLNLDSHFLVDEYDVLIIGLTTVF